MIALLKKRWLWLLLALVLIALLIWFAGPYVAFETTHRWNPSPRAVSQLL